MLWRRNEGGTEKYFSRQDAPLHYLTAAESSAYLHCHLYCLISTHLFWRVVLPFCKITVTFLGYRIAEIYIKYSYLLTCFDAMASLWKMTVPYSGYRIEEVYMKCKYIELSCSCERTTYYAPLHYLTAAVDPAYLHCHPDCLISTHIFQRVILIRVIG
jgi:hypothetical protein